MRVIMLGAPGAGKGTQADIISEKLGIPHISSGEIFRDNIKKQTELGKIVKEYTDSGKLVPDDITIEIIIKRLKEDDCKNGFILDGFPRTEVQADALSNKLLLDNLKVDMAIDIEVADNLIIERIIGRRVCLNCKATYHILHNPPEKSGICNNCQEALVQREDDKEETVKKRLAVYHEQTKPLINYYKGKGLLKVVNGEGSVESISAQIMKSLGR